MHVLGIDFGGSGIKGAPVDLDTGALLGERHRIDTPDPATPEAVAGVIARIVDHFDWDGPIGCTVPARVEHGLVRTASNIHESWLETHVERIIERATGLPVHAINDADAAGLASMAFGAGKGRNDFVFFITVGTGIGTAMFVEQVLVPNCELGHLPMHGGVAEEYASDRIRKEQGLTWQEWAGRFQEYLTLVEFLFAPDLIIIGGGVSRPHKADEYLDLLDTNAELVVAHLENEAGLIGAAYSARNLVKRSGAR
ncbi:MAG: ROK family protein [Rhodothermales bacterium]|nr:ROK family protein [Rhodothermales bacterium]